MLRPLDVQRHCPACGSDRSVQGHLNGGGVAVAFVPEGLRYAPRGGGRVPMQRVVRTCSECGLVWTMLDAVELRERLDAAGTDDTRRWLASEFDDRPLR